MSLQPEVAGLLMDRGADPARGDEMVPFGAKALVAILLATDQHDPVIRQLHELLKPRSAELPPQVPSRQSPSVDRTTGADRPVPPPAIRHEIHEAFISAQIRPPRRVNTQVNELLAVRACEGVTGHAEGPLLGRFQQPGKSL
jgi:hypothetical protein